MQLPPDDSLLPISSAVFETYGVTVVPSPGEDFASLDAAAGGADGVSMAPCVSETHVGAPVPASSPLRFTVLFVGLSPTQRPRLALVSAPCSGYLGCLWPEAEEPTRSGLLFACCVQRKSELRQAAKKGILHMCGV